MRVKRTVAEPEPQPFVFSEAVCVEGFASGWSDAVSKGRIFPRDHWLVEAHPEFWRLLGPRPDAAGVNDGG
jgi:hypothetical protein